MCNRFATAIAFSLCACGGAPAPTPVSPESSSPPPTEAPEATPAPEASQTAEAPPPPARHVTVGEIEIKGGGLTEGSVKAALDAQSDAFESCFAETLADVPDLSGRVLVSYLFVKGERKSVSASHAGMGAKTINPCFHKAASSATLEVDKGAERTNIVVTFNLSQDP